MQNVESNTQLIDDTIEENIHCSVVINNFPERRHEFQRKKIVPGEKSYNDVDSSKVYNTNEIVVFRDNINSFNRDIRSNFDEDLKNGRARFKYFPEATSNNFIYYINPNLEEGTFNTAVIHIEINDMLSNTSEEDSVLQNIPKKHPNVNPMVSLNSPSQIYFAQEKLSSTFGKNINFIILIIAIAMATNYTKVVYICYMQVKSC